MKPYTFQTTGSKGGGAVKRLDIERDGSVSGGGGGSGGGEVTYPYTDGFSTSQCAKGGLTNVCVCVCVCVSMDDFFLAQLPHT